MKQVIALIGILLLLFLYLFLFNGNNNSIEQFQSNNDQCIIECNNPGKTGKKGDTGDTGEQGITGKVGETGPSGQVGDTGPDGQPFDDWFREQPSTMTWAASDNANDYTTKNDNGNITGITDNGIIKALTQNNIFKNAIETAIKTHIEKVNIGDYFKDGEGNELLQSIIKGTDLSVPAYTIVPYYYVQAEFEKIQDKWQICAGPGTIIAVDGSDTKIKVPDLKDKFIKGAAVDNPHQDVTQAALTINNATFCTNINGLTYKTSNFKEQVNKSEINLTNVASSNHIHSIKAHRHDIPSHTHPITNNLAYTIGDHTHQVVGVGEHNHEIHLPVKRGTTENLRLSSDRVKSGGDDRTHKHKLPGIIDFDRGDPTDKRIPLFVRGGSGGGGGIPVDESWVSGSKWDTNTTEWNDTETQHRRWVKFNSEDSGTDDSNTAQIKAAKLIVTQAAQSSISAGGVNLKTETNTGELVTNIGNGGGEPAAKFTYSGDELTVVKTGTDIDCSATIDKSPEPAHFTLVFIIKKPLTHNT